ncbi:uncharacterized protein TNCV_4159611 [Trichonephila clavipes]|nr:uncharacterized protein TNCV_4159611 [Trichonephila clavipes]
MVIRSEGAVEYVMVGVSRRPTQAIWRGKEIEPEQNRFTLLDLDRGQGSRSVLVLIRGTMTIQRYVHYILQPHVLPLLQRLSAAIFQQDNTRPQTASPHCYYPSLTHPIPRFISNRAYLGSFGTASWASHEFEQTRDKVTVNME